LLCSEARQAGPKVDPPGCTSVALSLPSAGALSAACSLSVTAVTAAGILSLARAKAVNKPKVANKYVSESRKKRLHVEAVGCRSNINKDLHHSALGIIAPTGNIQDAKSNADAHHGIAHSASKYGLDMAAVWWPVASVRGNIL